MAFIPLEQQLHLAHDGLYFLYHESTPDGLVHSDFNASLAIAKMVMQGAEIQPSLLQNLNVGVIWPFAYSSLVHSRHGISATS